MGFTDLGIVNFALKCGVSLGHVSQAMQMITKPKGRSSHLYWLLLLLQIHVRSLYNQPTKPFQRLTISTDRSRLTIVLHGAHSNIPIKHPLTSKVKDIS